MVAVVDNPQPGTQQKDLTICPECGKAQHKGGRTY